MWSLTSSLQPHFSYSFTSFLLDIHLFIHLFDLSFVVFNILLPSLFLFIFINIISFDYPSISFIFIIALYRQAFCSWFQWHRKRQSQKKRQAAFKKIACKLYLKCVCDKSVWQYFMNTWIRFHNFSKCQVMKYPWWGSDCETDSLSSGARFYVLRL